MCKKTLNRKKKLYQTSKMYLYMFNVVYKCLDFARYEIKVKFFVTFFFYCYLFLLVIILTVKNIWLHKRQL